MASKAKIVSPKHIGPEPSYERAILFFQEQGLIVAQDIGGAPAVNAMLNALTNVAFRLGMSAEDFEKGMRESADGVQEAWAAMEFIFTEPEGEA